MDDNVVEERNEENRLNVIKKIMCSVLLENI